MKCSSISGDAFYCSNIRFFGFVFMVPCIVGSPCNPGKVYTIYRTGVRELPNKYGTYLT